MDEETEPSAAINWEKICPGLQLVISALEAVSPTTPSKLDDFALIGLKMVAARRCGAESFRGADEGISPEVMEKAAAVVEAFESAAVQMGP